MFRTARGFLLVAPLAFLAALSSFLLTHPGAAEAFTPYPFLVDALGQATMKRPVLRFSITSAVFFLVPYFTVGLLLFLADLGLGAAGPLWRGAARGGREEPPALATEALVTFVGASLLGAIVVGRLLHRVAHGGELPGGVNVAPLFVAAVPFGAVLAAVFLAGIAALPRALFSRAVAR